MLSKHASALPNYTAVVLAIDGDNTLWDTNSVFEDAQRRLLSLLDRARPECLTMPTFTLLRKVDDLLILHTGHQEYNFQLLVLALIYVRKGMTEIEAVSAAIREVQERPNSAEARLAMKINRDFCLWLQRIPPLLPYVAGSLEELSQLKACNRGRLSLVLLSEGKEARIRSILKSHFHKKTIFDVFHIVERKTTDALLDAQIQGSKVLESGSDYSQIQTQLVIVGDSIASDIVPGNSVGAITIYIAGGYRGVEKSTDDKESPNIILKSFCQLPKLIERILVDPTSTTLFADVI